MTTDPHLASKITLSGAGLNQAIGAVILLHGRGGSARDILSLGEEIAPEGWALLAPQAVGNSWYPNSFLVPRDQNEPYLSSALAVVSRSIGKALDAGIPEARIAVAGFSQGACLSVEYVSQNPTRYGALLAFTGGLIGAPGELPALSGNLAGTRALFGSGDPDPHVPWSRVVKSAEMLESIGAAVTLHRYPGRPHTIVNEEIEAAKAVLSAI